VRLAREPGRRESRYAHLFSGPVVAGTEDTEIPTHATRADSTSTAPPQAIRSAPAEAPGATQSRIDRLEAEVRQLRAELNDLKQRLGG
jgi:uncharacterized protein YceH (UPF0502 family)